MIQALGSSKCYKTHISYFKDMIGRLVYQGTAMDYFDFSWGFDRSSKPILVETT